MSNLSCPASGFPDTDSIGSLVSLQSEDSPTVKLFPSSLGAARTVSGSSPAFGPRGFGLNLNSYEDPTAMRYTATEMTPNLPIQAQSGSGSGTPFMPSSRTRSGTGFLTSGFLAGGPGGSAAESSGGPGGIAPGGFSPGGYAAGGFTADPLAVDQELSILGKKVLSARQMPLAQAWNTAQVPLGMVMTRPLYPSSHTAHFSSGYQRARDSRSHAKYFQDTFDHIPVSETHSTESKGQMIQR